MEAIVQQNEMECYRRVWAGTVGQEERREAVIPDTLPDAAEVVHTGGCALIRSKDVGEGQIRLEANLPVCICLRGEDGSLFTVDVNVPFYFNGEDPAIREGSRCCARLVPERLEAKLLNSRKIAVLAELSAELHCYAADRYLIPASVPEPGCCLHELRRPMELAPVRWVTEKTFVLTDEIILPPGKTPMAELLSRNTVLTVEELRCVSGKAVVKGRADSTLLYRSETQSVDLLEFSTGFSQIVDVPELSGTPQLSATALPSGVYYDLAPGYDGRSLKLELHAVVQLVCCERTETEFLADVYSNGFDLTVERESRKYPAVQQERRFRESCRVAVETAGAVAEVVGVSGEVIDCAAEKNAVSVRTRLALWYRDGAGTLLCADREAVLRLNAALGEAAEYSAWSGTLSNLHAVSSDVGAELRLDCEISALETVFAAADCICGLRYDETAPRSLDALPSLILLRGSSDSDLWKLAAENCSTVEAIREANQLDGESGTWEKLLLIPKTL